MAGAVLRLICKKVSWSSMTCVSPKTHAQTLSSLTFLADEITMNPLQHGCTHCQRWVIGPVNASFHCIQSLFTLDLSSPAPWKPSLLPSCIKWQVTENYKISSYPFQLTLQNNGKYFRKTLWRCILKIKAVKINIPQAKSLGFFMLCRGILHQPLSSCGCARCGLSTRVLSAWNTAGTGKAGPVTFDH